MEEMIKNSIYRYDTFEDGKSLHNKKKGRLPAMGWNSWNAFGSGNTEELTKAMAEKIIELGLDKLGYKYVVLDDGCYKSERIDGLLSNEEVKFPSGFKTLSDYIHSKGLKFGMYNDIGTNLCAGAAVGTCGHEMEDAKSYIDWGIDFIKVDNCYYLWDNATFSNPENAKYVFAPNIKSVSLCKLDDAKSILNDGENEINSCDDGLLCKHKEIIALSAVNDGIIIGERAYKTDDYVTFIGTFDGTGPDRTPTRMQSSELTFKIMIPQTNDYELVINYATGKEEGVGSFLQLAVKNDIDNKLIYDDFLPESEDTNSFIDSKPILVRLNKGENILRIMNHRRQENTLGSYGTLLEAFNKIKPDNDIILSACEWGKTFPQDWAYKVCDSWRILNDITFQVGADGNPGVGAWNSDYTTSVAAQYNKAVIMDEFSGLDKGWNDPDMMMIGMNGLNETMCKSHMAMWCMMNSPLMLGLDLRKVNKGDWIYNIVANKELVNINQDALGIQAKRIYSSYLNNADNLGKKPDKEYIRDINRVDVLCKPLSDGSFALSFINLDDKKASDEVSISIDLILDYLGDKLIDKEKLIGASSFKMLDLWTGEEKIVSCANNRAIFYVNQIEPCDNITYRIYPIIK